jgi:hypothetical protein
MSFDLRKTVERHGHPIDPSMSEDEGLMLWAAEIWALPDADLELLAERLEAVNADAGQEADVRILAARLLDAVDHALVGKVPSIEMMRPVGEAVTAVRHAQRNSMKGW